MQLPNDRPRFLDRRQFIRSAAGGALTVAGAIGCGSGGSGGGVPENPGGSTLSDTTRMATLDSVQTFAQSIDLADFAGAQQQILNNFLPRPEFNTASVTPGGVSAVFVDGVVTHIIMNRAAKPGENTGPDSGRAAPSRGTEVPQGSLAALLLNAMGSAFRNEAGVIAPAVNSKDYVVKNGAGDIESLRNFGKPAFFYLSAHGDQADVPVIQNGKYVKDAQGKFTMEPAFAVSTSTAYDGAAQATYRTEILLGQVAAGVCLESIVGGKGVFAKRLLVTTRWVKAYWGFSPNSLIWISACSSNSSISQDFVQACLAAANGAALYVGWSDFTEGDHAVQVSKFVIDRVLGANKLSPVETPNQRPFDFVQVYDDLRKRNLHSRPTLNPDTGSAFGSRTTEVIFTQGGASKFGLLAPTISRVLVSEYEKQAILLGTFGLPPESDRAVLIGGIEAHVDSWAEDKILCTLPETGTGSSGDVVVIVRAHKSNVRRITEWTFNMRYKWFGDPSPLIVNGQFTMRYRADVGTYRTKPAETPIEPLRTAITTADTHGSMTASGQVLSGDCTITWSKSVTLGVPNATPAPPNLIASYLEVDTKTKAGLIGLAFGSLAPQWFNQLVRCPNTPDVSADFAVAAITSGQHDFADPTETGHPAVPLLSIPLTFQQNFSVTAGAVEEAIPHLRWEWDAVTPQFPPLADAARSVG